MHISTICDNHINDHFNGFQPLCLPFDSLITWCLPQHSDASGNFSIFRSHTYLLFVIFLWATVQIKPYQLSPESFWVISDCSPCLQIQPIQSTVQPRAPVTFLRDIHGHGRDSNPSVAPHHPRTKPYILRRTQMAICNQSSLVLSFISLHS